MIWLVLEGVLALSLFIFIIWWTMPRKPRDKTASGAKSNAAETMDAEDDKKINRQDARKDQINKGSNGEGI